MTGRTPGWLAAPASLMALALSWWLGVSSAAAARDRTPPTTPTDLRATGMTPYSVPLAWTPATDNSGSFIYHICCAHTSSESFPAPASSHTYRAGLEPGRSVTLRIFAVNAAGNSSGYSNAVTVTLPPDTTPPTTPVVLLTDVGPTHVSLAWSSTEDGPHVWFTVFMNGTTLSQGSRETSGTFSALEPGTPYTFTVQAQDFGGHVSPISDPITVTTEPSQSDDATPPQPLSASAGRRVSRLAIAPGSPATGAITVPRSPTRRSCTCPGAIVGLLGPTCPRGCGR